MVAPKEITVPLPGGAVDVLSEIRVTPAWAIRPEVVTILSAGF
jgi:tagatose-1,6-bisphosphate aldolase non-catalytic subunit AgaZ/GatZ